MDKIGVMQFAILQNTPPKNCNLTTTLSFKADHNNQHVASIAKFDYVDNDEKLFLTIEVQCEFIIHPEDWKLLEKDNQKLDIPNDLLEIFAAQTVGTARGILYLKTENTPYNTPSFIIPPINVHEILTSKQDSNPEEISN